MTTGLPPQPPEEPVANIEGQADHAAPIVQTQGWSPKALFATLAAVVVPLVLQGIVLLIEALSANPTLFDGLSPTAKGIISTVITAAGVLAAAYGAKPGNVTIGGN